MPKLSPLKLDPGAQCRLVCYVRQVMSRRRRGHAHPGFTMATYQHLVPGMSATAAIDFANMIATAPPDDGR